MEVEAGDVCCVVIANLLAVDAVNVTLSLELLVDTALSITRLKLQALFAIAMFLCEWYKTTRTNI